MKLKPTPEQQLIIKHLHGHAMVKAGPGCAKTSTLALRAKHLLDMGCDPKSIAIVTYSKALTLDIAKTLTKQLGKYLVKQITVKTIHGLALRLVTRHHKEQGLSKPMVLKAQTKKQFIQYYAKKHKLKNSELSQAFYHYETGNDTQVETILGKNKAALVKSAYKRYSIYKQKRNKLDFEDMIVQALKLLKSGQDPSSILLPYQHLMVDELQDIDGPQKELLLHLSRRMKTTVMVGDPLQSIYGWRRALPRYWDDIEKSIKPKQFELTQSFRIPRQALPLVNDLATRIDDDAPVLNSQIEGECPELIALVDQDAQHRWLDKEIKALLDKEVDSNQIAILGKTKKELSQIALALRARGIEVIERYQPTKINQHSVHLLALIQLTRLEQQRVGKSSKRLNLEEQELARSCMENLWLTKKTIQHLQERLPKKPKAILGVKSDRKDYGRINDLSKALKKAAALPCVESAVQCLIDATKPALKDRDFDHHKLLLRDLTDIKIKARDCASLDDMDDEWFELSKKDKAEGVQMMTVHSAKGQEWDYVFLINVVDGVYP